MAGKCKWCGKPARNKYCYRHYSLGRVLDDVREQLVIIRRMRSGLIEGDLAIIHKNLEATEALVQDELGRS